MDSCDWLVTDKLDQMLMLLRAFHYPKDKARSSAGSVEAISERKARLFACNAARCDWNLLTGPKRQCVLASEETADKPMTRDRQMLLDAICRSVWNEANHESWLSRLAMSCCVYHSSSAIHTIEMCCGWRNRPVEYHDILRDMVGNPFHPVIVLPRDIDSLLAFHAALRKSSNEPVIEIHQRVVHLQQDVIEDQWLTLTVTSLAKASYQSANENGVLDTYGLLNVADAMEEAGCTSTALVHLRNGKHWRGCHIIDAILGKK